MSREVTIFEKVGFTGRSQTLAVGRYDSKQLTLGDNVLSSLPSDELFEKLQIPSIPAVFVYDRTGKLVKVFDNSEAETEEQEFTYKDVTKLVSSLVKK